jgi:hypothetical protein
MFLYVTARTDFDSISGRMSGVVYDMMHIGSIAIFPSLGTELSYLNTTETALSLSGRLI